MQFLTRRLAVAVVLIGALIVPTTQAAGAAVTRHCGKTYTLAMFKRAVDRVYASTDLPPRGSYGHLHRYLRCQRKAANRARARVYWRAAIKAWGARRSPPLQYAVASWYQDAGGGTACGFVAAYGVANRDLPCGTTVLFSYNGRTVTATVDDRGPFIAGRDWDLGESTANALGFSGVDTVGFRIGG